MNNSGTGKDGRIEADGDGEQPDLKDEVTEALAALDEAMSATA